MNRPDPVLAARAWLAALMLGAAVWCMVGVAVAALVH